MIPYFQAPAGAPWSVLLTLAGMIGMHMWMLRRGPRSGLTPSLAAGMHAFQVLGAIEGGFLAGLLYEPELKKRFLAAPLEVIQLGGFSSFGWIYTGFLGAGVYLFARRVPPRLWLRYVDVAALAFPLWWLAIRIGCSFEHDHPGARTASWIGVQFPGGTRFDLGMLEAIYTLGLLLLFVRLDRAPRPGGFFLGLFLILYGGFRLLLDQIGIGAPIWRGLNLNQWFSLEGLALGAFISVISRRGVAA